MKTKYIAMLMGLLLGSVTTASNAGIQDAFNDIIGQHNTNVTPPTSGDMEMMGMGFLSGGSIEIRRKVSAPKLLAFDPPRAKSGCNGWSLFGGSLSYIKLDQFVEYAREILTNSAAYLFEIALKAICSTCAQTMDLLRQGADAINNSMRDSCSMAKSLMNKAAMQITENENALSGAVSKFNDNLETKIKAYEAGTSDFYNLREAAEVDGNAAALAVLNENTTNLLFKAMNKNDMIVSIFPDLHNKNTVDYAEFRLVMEEVQSLTGTLVAEVIDQKSAHDPESDAPDATQSDVKLSYKGPPTLDFDILFKGEKTVNEEVAQQTEILGCQETKDDDPFCVKVTSYKRSASSLTGLLVHFEEVIIGSSGAGGILGKLRLPGSQLTIAEQSFLRSTKVPVLDMLNNVANAGAMGNTLAAHIARLIAAERFVEFMTQLLKAVDASVLKQIAEDEDSRVAVAAFQERIMELNKEVYDWATKIAGELEQSEQLISLYMNLVKSTHGRNYYTDAKKVRR